MIGAHLDDSVDTDAGSVYVFDLAPSYPADLNGDCEVDTIDFLAYLTDWSAGCS